MHSYTKPVINNKEHATLLLKIKNMNYQALFFLFLSFTFIDLNSDSTLQKVNYPEKKSLKSIIESHKGNVIYLDFWASWCKPCRKEIMKMKKIKESLKGKKVSFIYISLDLDKVKCDDAIKNDGVIEENYLSHEIKNDLGMEELNKIKSIPRYVIFDKKGKLVNPEAPSPSQKNKLLAALNQYLIE